MSATSYTAPSSAGYESPESLSRADTHEEVSPGDIAVGGWDDIPEASFGFPSLTTIAPDIAQIASVASALLVAEIEGTRDGEAETEAGYVLRVRESAP